MSEMAELDSLNEMLKSHIQKITTEHKQQLETQHRELEVMCSHLIYMHLCCMHMHVMNHVYL